MYHVFGIPVGAGTILLNVPVAIFCYKYLGRIFFLKSAKSMIISSLLMDYVAPLLPVYGGSRLLAALCMGVLTGIGYALIFMRGSSTGGQDFITVAIRKARPHMTLGIITFVLDMITILLGSLIVFKEVDGFIYGVIVTYLMASVMDRIMYGIDEGKMTLIVTEKRKRGCSEDRSVFRQRVYYSKRNRKLFQQGKGCCHVRLQQQGNVYH